MTRRRVTKELAKAREQRAYELRQEGMNQDEIAIELGVSQSAVSQMLKRIYHRVTLTFTEIAVFKRVEMLARYEVLYVEAVKAWHLIKRPIRRRITRQRGTRKIGEVEFETADVIHIVEQTEERNGDPRFLEAAIKILEAQGTLLGLYNPRSDLPPDEMKREEAMQRIQEFEDLKTKLADKLTLMMAELETDH